MPRGSRVGFPLCLLRTQHRHHAVCAHAVSSSSGVCAVLVPDKLLLSHHKLPVSVRSDSWGQIQPARGGDELRPGFKVMLPCLAHPQQPRYSQGSASYHDKNECLQCFHLLHTQQALEVCSQLEVCCQLCFMGQPGSNKCCVFAPLAGPKMTGVECVEGMAAGLYEELFAALVSLINRYGGAEPRALCTKELLLIYPWQMWLCRQELRLPGGVEQ